ncbi:hypothetical protein AWB80_06253 [Caballeronia pedi]|uniref:Uncharacterized protein n=2 Tax=Caballeronia pedi TaxID=1777141 RepID=A0A158D3K5_9BURK|nr:hypothetical protein AWB80_06253 [Caballeronia pedi]
MIRTGERVFTIDSGKSFLVGQSVMAVAGNNWLRGEITAYADNLLTVNVTSSNGDGRQSQQLVDRFDWYQRP